MIGVPKTRLISWLSHTLSDLEKVVSGACGHFIGNHTILRTFSAKYPVFFTEDRKRRVEDGELRLDKRDLR